MNIEPRRLQEKAFANSLAIMVLTRLNPQLSFPKDTIKRGWEAAK
jgi:hypothetical protein